MKGTQLGLEIDSTLSPVLSTATLIAQIIFETMQHYPAHNLGHPTNTSTFVRQSLHVSDFSV